MRQAMGSRRPPPPELIDTVWKYWDKGTRAATLALYRHADPGRLALAGREQDKLTCPALVLWGNRDPYLPAKFGEAYAHALPDVEFEPIDDAGHWPWIDDERVVDRVVDFVGRSHADYNY